MKVPIRVLIVDDHPLLRLGIRETLTSITDIEMVGEARDGYEAPLVAARTMPDVVLLDLTMPGPGPLEVIAAVQEAAPACQILVVTAYDDDVVAWAVVQAGVAGYMLKDEVSDALPEAIRTVASGATWFSRLIMHKMVRVPNPPVNPMLQLNFTERELDILGGIALGWDNIAIARHLYITPQTVRNYVSRLYEKISVSGRAAAVLWAREHGFDKRDMQGRQ